MSTEKNDNRMDERLKALPEIRARRIFLWLNSLKFVTLPDCLPSSMPVPISFTCLLCETQNVLFDLYNMGSSRESIEQFICSQ